MRMPSLFYSYLGKDTLRGFDSYKYSCRDTSPLSNYIMHPFWNQVIKICPMWVAPNLLTFVGFLCCVAHFYLPAIWDYDYMASTLNSDHPVPNWAWLTVSGLLFLSHTLDGIDGKQARRTGTSSPLGELFDHGCDAWATTFIAGTFYSPFGNNADGYSISQLRMYLILWAVFFTFHVSHWEKYNTGVMYLPWSYDFAMLAGCTLYLLTGLFGYGTWKVKLPGDYSAGLVLEAVLYIGVYGFSFPVAVKNIVTVYQRGEQKQRSLTEALRPLVSFFTAFALCLTWVLMSPNHILELDTRCFFLMSGTLYANMSCRLIVAQMSGTRSELYNFLLWPLAASAALAAGVRPSWFGPTAELALVYALTALVLVTHLHYVVCVVAQMCDHLRIRCFSIDSRGEPRLIPESEEEEEELILAATEMTEA